MVQRILGDPPLSVSLRVKDPGPLTVMVTGEPVSDCGGDDPPLTSRVFTPLPVPVTVNVVLPGHETDTE